MNYLCRNKPLAKLSHDEIHVELAHGWDVFNQLAGSIYKDAIWDDLQELAHQCPCMDNETKAAMLDLVAKQPQNFW